LQRLLGGGVRRYRGAATNRFRSGRCVHVRVPQNFPNSVSSGGAAANSAVLPTTLRLGAFFSATFA